MMLITSILLASAFANQSPYSKTLFKNTTKHIRHQDIDFYGCISGYCYVKSDIFKPHLFCVADKHCFSCRVSRDAEFGGGKKCFINTKDGHIESDVTCKVDSECGL